MFWRLAVFAQGVLALTTLTAAVALVTVLVRRSHLRRNPAATAAVALLLVVGVLAALRTAYLVLPGAGVDLAAGYQVRQSYDRLLAWWDVVTAVVAVVALTRRRLWDALLSAPARTQVGDGLRSTAARLNDDVAQELALARYALDAGDAPRVRSALDTALGASRAVVAEVLGERRRVIHLDPEPRDEPRGPRSISLPRTNAPR